MESVFHLLKMNSIIEQSIIKSIKIIKKGCPKLNSLYMQNDYDYNSLIQMRLLELKRRFKMDLKRAPDRIRTCIFSVANTVYYPLYDRGCKNKMGWDFYVPPHTEKTMN